jgi:hypothetical protein
MANSNQVLNVDAKSLFFLVWRRSDLKAGVSTHQQNVDFVTFLLPTYLDTSFLPC